MLEWIRKHRCWNQELESGEFGCDLIILYIFLSVNKLLSFFWSVLVLSNLISASYIFDVEFIFIGMSAPVVKSLRIFSVPCDACKVKIIYACSNVILNLGIKVQNEFCITAIRNLGIKVQNEFCIMTEFC